MKITWVTSCSQDMYVASARNLIKSFWQHKVPGTLVFCYEQLGPRTDERNVVNIDITGHAMLRGFLQKWGDYVPRHLGGRNSGRCECPGGPYNDPHSLKHQLPCVGHWFCRNAFRWFRKLVSICEAGRVWKPAQDEQDGVLVWLDADCVFTAAPTDEVINAQWLPGDTICCYHKGPHRKWLEGGVSAFRIRPRGLDLLEAWVGMYASGKFLELPRWDDCATLQTTIARPEFAGHCLDLGGKLGPHAEVIDYSPVGKYITHFKGRHGRGLGLMT